MRLARSSAAQREEEQQQEQCDLCGEPVPPEHRHLLDLNSRELMCACRACTILFDRKAAGGSHYCLVPDRRLSLEDFLMDDVAWASLRIPVEMAFFFRSGEEQGVQAYYPGPMGATESLLELSSWEDLERDNPVLATLEPEVEALLVNRSRGARQHFVVPIEECYRLVGLIRIHWRGLSGGKEVWEEIEGFFGELSQRAKTVTTEEEERATWQT